MSGWDWLRLSLDMATYVQASRANRNLDMMRTAAEIETAKRELINAMKDFIFEISRDVRLLEEQIDAHPQQVYIVAMVLAWRLTDSGLSADLFPDFQDKEYVFQTQKKIAAVVGQSKARLNKAQVRQSDAAIQYIREMPMLQKAINATSAKDSLTATEEKWKKLLSRHQKTQEGSFLRWGALAAALFLGFPVTMGGLCFMGGGDFASVIFGGITFLVGLTITIALVKFFNKGRRSGTDPAFQSLKSKRERWQRQLVSVDEWHEIVASFGNLNSKQFRELYQQRVNFLESILGAGFHKYILYDGQ